MICILTPYFYKSLRLLSRVKLKHVVVIFGVIMLMDFFGAFTHIFEVSYERNFSYPYEGDISEFVDALKHDKKPTLAPINNYNIAYIHENEDRCKDEEKPLLRVVFLVKSSIDNFNRRAAIRHSWGFKQRFSDVPTRTVFLLGKRDNDEELQRRVNAEVIKYGDIVQADFIDDYYNNTIKTMIGFKWAVTHCLNSKFYMFVDDDIYVSVKNVLRFTRHPLGYPEYLSSVKSTQPDAKNRIFPRRQKVARSRRASAKEKIALRRKPGWISHNKTVFPKSVSEINDDPVHTRALRQVLDIDLPDDVRLYAGYVIQSSPLRHKISKWYVSLEEYPYDSWPPYVTAGAYILSKNALVDLYYTSFYTKHFRFDDIYLGLLAKKADIDLFHCDEFHFVKKPNTKDSYKYVITSHGYDNPTELVETWNEQKAWGNA